MKYMWVVLMSFLFSTGTLCVAQSSHLEAGAAFFKQQQYDKALEEFKRAQLKNPLDASIENLLGITEAKCEHVDESTAHYKRAIELDPEMLSPHKNLAVNYLGIGRYDLAEAELAEALKISAGDPFVHYYLATLYLATSRDKEAVAQLPAAQSLIANDPELLYTMALACLRLHMDSKAVTLIADYEKRFSSSVAQEYEVAILLTKDKMYEAAVPHFRKIVKDQPDSWSSRFDLALSLLNADQNAEALPILEKLASERATDPNALALLGSAYEMRGDSVNALNAYKRAVGADPNNPDRYLDYTRLLMDLDRYGEAAQIIQSGLNDSSDPYALDLRMGSIRMIQGQYVEARLSFERAIGTHPDVALGYFALAQSYMREGHDQDASDVLAKARIKLPPDAMLEYLNGLALSHLGKNTEASGAFKQSIALDEVAPQAHYELGKVLFQEGLVGPAKAEFERVIQLAPEDPNAYYQLSRISARLGDKGTASQMAKHTQQLLQQQRANALQAERERLPGFQDPAPR